MIGKMINSHHQSNPANDTKNIAVTIATSKYSVLIRRFIRNDCFMLMIVLRNEWNTNSFVLLSEDVQSFKIYNEWAILGASIYIVNFQEHT